MGEFITISKEKKRWGFKIKLVTFAGASYFIFTDTTPQSRSQGANNKLKLDRFEGKSVANWNQAKMNGELNKIKSKSVRFQVSMLPVQIQKSITEQLAQQAQAMQHKKESSGCVLQ